MDKTSRSCTICSSEADWVRVQRPNEQQMNYLCDRHYQSLRQRNATMAAWYEHIAAVPPVAFEPEGEALEERRRP